MKMNYIFKCKIFLFGLFFLSLLCLKLSAADGLEDQGTAFADMNYLVDTQCEHKHIKVKIATIHQVKKYLVQLEFGQLPEKENETIIFDEQGLSNIIFVTISQEHYYNLIVQIGKSNDRIYISKFIFINSEEESQRTSPVDFYILRDLISEAYDKALEVGKSQIEAEKIVQYYRNIPSLTYGLGIQRYDYFLDKNCAFYAADIAQAIKHLIGNGEFGSEPDKRLKAALPQFFDDVHGSFIRKPNEYLIAWGNNKRLLLKNKKKQ